MAGSINDTPIIRADIAGVRGGTASLENIVTNQETILDMARSAQSITYTPVVGATETIIYEVTPTAGPQLILLCRLDLTNMVSGDTLIIRKYVKVASGGSYLLASTDIAYTFTGAQTVKVIELFENTVNSYGCKFAIVQTTGTARAFLTETFDAAAGV